MKFETVLLQLLFSACAVVCVLVMGSMIVAKAPPATAAASQVPVVVAADSQA